MGLGLSSSPPPPNLVVDVGGLRRVDHPNDLQLDVRRQHLEQPAATAEQHRDLVVVTAPVVDDLGGPPSHEDRAGRVHLVDQPFGRPGRPEEVPFLSDAPVVQPFAAVSQAVAGSVSPTIRLTPAGAAASIEPPTARREPRE